MGVDVVVGVPVGVGVSAAKKGDVGVEEGTDVPGGVSTGEGGVPGVSLVSVLLGTGVAIDDDASVFTGRSGSWVIAGAAPGLSVM